MLDHDVGIAGTDVPVIVWVNSTSVEKVAKTGNPIIHAASDYFYLDCGAGGWVGDFLGQSWCPYVSWQQTYSFNPVSCPRSFSGPALSFDLLLRSGSQHD